MHPSERLKLNFEYYEKGYEKYYIYCHYRLDKNEPFYVGIGTKPKKYRTVSNEYNRAFDSKKRNSIWKRITAKTDYEVEILFESFDRIEIQNKEIEFICLYGRIDDKTGTLCNLTSGGDGGNGIKWTESQKEKQRFKMKGINAGGKKYCARKVIDLNTMTVYDCIKSAAKHLKVDESGLGKMLKGINKNLTSCMYLSDYKEGKELKKYKRVHDKIRVLDKETGVAYESISALAREKGLNPSVLSSQIRKGRAKNIVRLEKTEI